MAHVWTISIRCEQCGTDHNFFSTPVYCYPKCSADRLRDFPRDYERQNLDGKSIFDPDSQAKIATHNLLT